MSRRTILHWFRRDLRVEDNTALLAARRDADRVVPVFVLDDHYGNDRGIGPSRFRFLRDSLEQLEKDLRAIGGRLIVRRGPAARALRELAAETEAAAVHANAEVGPYPQSRDQKVLAALGDDGLELRLFPDALLVEPDVLASGSGEPYRTFSPFAKRWDAAEKRGPAGSPTRLDTPDLPSVALDRVRAWRQLDPDPRAPRGGASEAARLLARFVSEPLATYARDRNFPARPGTSRLSAHLHFGTISPRTIRAAALEALTSGRASAADAHRFLSELAWREFFHHVLFHFPRVAIESFRRDMDGIAWRDDPASLAAWKEGRTGYPIVDAAMRELSATHWMHNRARMVAGSFLTKDLHVHWREGEAWFAYQLADADLANNNGGWQWVAGTGTDAAPYFRIFHPVLQGKRFDPQGEYVKRYVPELARAPAAKIHEPWSMVAREQREAGCVIGRDYPAPIVDHGRERRRALEMLASRSLKRN